MNQIAPQAQELLNQLNAHTQPNADSLSPEEQLNAAREGYRASRVLAGTPEDIFKVEDRSISSVNGEIPLRLYVPNAEGNLPIVVYFHGGGFTAGDFDTHDTPLRALANRSGCLIVAVGYRLAPEHPFPAAPEDCYNATVWAAENAAQIGGNPNQIAVAGDSAGGDLAAVVTLMARDKNAPKLSYQVLIYPDTDLTESSASWTEFATTNSPIITREGKLAAISMYVPRDVDVKNPYVSPLYAESLTGLPPALIITAEFDPQRDEGEAYARNLKEAGVEVKHIRYDGMIHGFFQMAGVLAQGKEAIEEVANSLKNAFQKQ